MDLLKIKHLPLTIVIGFNLFTLFIFYTAPVRWASDNLLLFFIFAITCQLMIILGFNRGYNKSQKINVSNAGFHTFSNSRINFVFYFYAFTFLIKYAYLLKFGIFEVSGMFNFLLIGFVDPKLGYFLATDVSRPHTISWSIFFLISIINQAYFLIGFLKWNELNKIKKGVFLLFLLIEIFYWLGRGTNFGIISLITTFAFAYLFKLKWEKFNLGKVLRFYFLILIFLAGSIYVFSYNLNKRANDTKLDFQDFNIGLSTVNERSKVFEILPEAFHQTYLFVVFYLGQGYLHTSMAFDLPFIPTYFLGNNPAIIDFSDVIGIDTNKDTYVYRLKDKGVDPTVNWHSSYTWYASDVTFYGVPFVMLFLGYILGSSWGWGRKSNDFLSQIVFIISANMILYIFANNNYLASVFYSFALILSLWFLTRVLRIRL